MKPKLKIPERISKIKEQLTGIPLTANKHNTVYEGNYNIIKLKIYDRLGRNAVEHSALRINYLRNLGFSSKGITRQNLKEMDTLIKETLKIAKEKNIKIITFSTWIFFEHPEIETYFKKRYNLELFADHTLDKSSLFEKKFENKRIKGIDFKKRTIIYTDSKGRLHENYFAFIDMPEYAFKIKD
ncbi:MAG TPA: hypothetical protein PK685_02860 [archaeon]|nr:hypothetical protein [archaeon]